ncbi:peptidase M4 [Actinomadura sp. KC06]|uniref:PepSY domain-containing protein n=1 Tax=Actinomadura sp. KC06 TaxID=2530369 RepID=UPI00104419F7|nr:PepSY domain-containing protein [Actinomadura sp. KC06]TDD20084.1 peptidase M4 [Actinomadura sp. KC06]
MRIDARRFVSGRGLLVTVVAAGVLAGGGAATAFAANDGPGTPTPPSGGASPRSGAQVTAAEAAAAALKASPGTVEEIELDDDDGGRAWEIDIVANGGGRRDVTVDSGTGKVLSDRAARPDDGDDDGDDDDDDRPLSAAALRKAQVSAADAVGAALKAVPGTVTSVDFESEDGKALWEVDVTGPGGTEHELTVDAANAKVLTNGTDEDDD